MSTKLISAVMDDIEELQRRILALEVRNRPREKKDRYVLTVGSVVRGRHYDNLLRITSVEGDRVYMEEC